MNGLIAAATAPIGEGPNSPRQDDSAGRRIRTVAPIAAALVCLTSFVTGPTAEATGIDWTFVGSGVTRTAKERSKGLEPLTF